MDIRIPEIIKSAIALSVVGYAVWPWGDVPWKWIAYLPESVDGDLEIAILTIALTAAIGFGILAVTEIRFADFALGGILAYVFWMGILAIAVSLHEPLLPPTTYGLVLLGVLLGAGIRTVIARGSSPTPTTRSL